ncbi:hypothetical protein RhiirA4_479196 [Rhizophagus irregularis]|uniref:Uncharacterized protein n=1 Tax=Rhizophagus irregularis TaxID=588596 RepID=A0A2I1HG20_9GLOM|nr:hypothetical protein RhiirA4_479196 [Rhizophagus irregularis]
MNHIGLFLLPSLFYYTPDREIKYCWNNKYKNKFNQTLFDEPTDEPTDESTDGQTKFVFGILNERVWKSKFDENSDELSKENNKIVECDEYLNVHLSNLYNMDTMSRLFQKAEATATKQWICIIDSISIEYTRNLIKWNVRYENSKIELAVFKKINTKWEPINTKVENYIHCPSLINGSSFNNNDIVILTTSGILIYTFSEKNKSIFLNYFYSFKIFNIKTLQDCKRMFSKSTLPLPNYDSFKLDGWVSDVMNHKSSLLKYGVELLKFAIKEHNHF